MGLGISSTNWSCFERGSQDVTIVNRWATIHSLQNLERFKVLDTSYSTNAGQNCLAVVVMAIQ